MKLTFAKYESWFGLSKAVGQNPFRVRVAKRSFLLLGSWTCELWRSDCWLWLWNLGWLWDLPDLMMSWYFCFLERWSPKIPFSRTMLSKRELLDFDFLFKFSILSVILWWAKEEPFCWVEDFFRPLLLRSSSSPCDKVPDLFGGLISSCYSLVSTSLWKE